MGDEMEAITDMLRTVLLSTLAVFSPGMRLLFYEIIDANAMTIRLIARVRSDKDGTLWVDDIREDESVIYWTDRYPESYLKTIQYDILLPGEITMFDRNDQEKLMNQEIGGLLAKAVYVTRTHLGEKDFYGALVIESVEKEPWKQNELIEIIQASEKIALGILCNDVWAYMYGKPTNRIPVSFSQIPAHAVVLDDYGTVLYAPYAISEILGYRAYGEMINRNIGKFSHPDDAAIIQDIRKSRKDSGGIKVVFRNIRFITRTKGLCLCKTQLMSAANDTTILFVSPPQWYEHEKSKDRDSVVCGYDFLKYFAEQVDGIVWVVNDKLEFTYVSSMVTNLLGWSVDQVIHDNRVSLFDRDTLDKFADVLMRGALAYRADPSKRWSEEITGNALTLTGARVPVVIRITINTLGGDYQGFGGVIKLI
jgi:PAS domain-containing protein